MFDLYRDRKVSNGPLTRAFYAILRGVLFLLTPIVRRYQPQLLAPEPEPQLPLLPVNRRASQRSTHGGAQ